MAGLSILMLLAAAASADGCDPATAERASVADIVEGDRIFAACVTVEAIAWKGALFDDVAAIYAKRNRANGDAVGNIALGLPRRRVPLGHFEIDADAITGDPAGRTTALSGFYEGARRVRATGHVQMCRYTLAKGMMDDMPPRGAPLPCLGNRGRVLAAESIEVIYGPVERLLAADARPEAVRLRPLAVDSPWLPRFETAANAIEMALRAGDAEQWVPLFGGQWLGDAERAQVAALLNDPGGPFRDAFRTGRSERVILGWAPPVSMTAEERAETAARPQAESMICWSSRADAARLWPIAAMDADNAPGRPHACVRVTYSIRGGEEKWRAFIERDDSGLAEPA